MLAAGKGTRMKSQIPKVLHRLCGRAMVSLVVDAAEAAGFGAKFVVVPPDSLAIRNALQNGVSYVTQSDPLGSGHALLQTRGHLKAVENVVVLYGDVPLIRPETLRSMMRLHLERQASITLLTASVTDSDGLGRVTRDASGDIDSVVEDSEADEETRRITEVNAGIYCFRSSWLWPSLDSLAPSSSGEIFLTDLVSAASQQGNVIESLQVDQPHEATGVNTRVQLAEAEAALRQSLRERWMLSGVTLTDPDSTYVDFDVELGEDTVVHPNTHINGASRIGRRCEIGPNTIVSGSQIGDECRVMASVIEGSTLEDDVQVGPFSHIRLGSHLGKGVHIGNFAEVKKSRLGRGTKSGHFSYIGDAEVGANVNVGAGTVTCNFDGTNKHRTRIEDDAFIGSDSMLVAPITIGTRSSTGVGAVVTKDVPPDSLAVGVPARVRSKKGRDARK